jgi:hypothetical protein
MITRNPFDLAWLLYTIEFASMIALLSLFLVVIFWGASVLVCRLLAL